MIALLRKNRHQLVRRTLLSVFIGCLLLQISFHGTTISVVRAFATTPDSKNIMSVVARSNNGLHNTQSSSPPSQQSSCSSSSSLAMGVSSSTSRIGVSVPSQAKCETLGVREWPQQSKKGAWNEKVDPDTFLVRYVLEGTGSLVFRVEGDGDKISVKPGTLVEIKAGTPAVQLEWECDSNCPEVILLTPGFEEGNVFLGAIVGIVVLFGALLSGALG
jgi:hypothetical protein